MGYIPVPNDLNKIETKAFFGLSKKKLVGYGIAIPLGAIGYFIGSVILPELGMVLLLALAMPPIIMASYDHKGIPATEVIKDYLKAKKIRPAIRKYKETSKNMVLNRKFVFLKQEGVVKDGKENKTSTASNQN